MRWDAFQAIADPTRRTILSLVSQKPLTINSVAVNFEVSRTAIYKHIKILTACGLIIIRQQGRERYCEAKMAKLNEVDNWVSQYRKCWSEKFDTLDIYLEKCNSQQSKAVEKSN